MDYKNTIQNYVNLINLDSQVKVCFENIHKGFKEDYIAKEKQHLLIGYV